MNPPRENEVFTGKALHRKPRLPRICTALAGPDMFGLAHRLANEFSFFEFRLDTLDNPEHAIPALREFLQTHPAVVAIATCRRDENGGHFTGTAQEEALLLRLAAEAGAQLIDLSIESAEDLDRAGAAILSALRTSSAALLLSWHDFQGTPDLLPVYERMRTLQPDFYKIVPTARTLQDSLALVDFLRVHGSTGNLIAMSMGVAGVMTRILGPVLGSTFTFGSADAGSETAPGQVSSRTLRDLYRIEKINAQTKVYGVFGKPIGGSKSPVMLNTAFRATQCDAVYLPLETDDTHELFACVERIPLAGASVTMPLKEQIVPRLPLLSGLAAELGAANTLVRIEDGVRGENTDVAGILQPLEQRLPLSGARVLVLGAGGAARAAVHALRSRGAQVAICNRTHHKAEELARITGSTALLPESLAKQHFDVVLNATPYGMVNQQIEPPIDPDGMNCRIFFDMVYNPVETPLVQIARSKGIEVILGIEMFVTQGAAQFELWTGKPAPLEAMRTAVLESLQTTR